MAFAEERHELLVEHVSSHGPKVLQVRGSLILSSLATLRETQMFDRYLSHLPASDQEQVLYAAAGGWLPIEVAMAHYGACEAMQLSESELDAMGRGVSERIMKTFLGTLVRTARLFVPKVQIPLRQYPRLWDRLLVGGACTVSMSGINDARIESKGVPMFRYRYFRTAYAALIRGAALTFRTNANARIRNATDDSLTIDLVMGSLREPQK